MEHVGKTENERYSNRGTERKHPKIKSNDAVEKRKRINRKMNFESENKCVEKWKTNNREMQKIWINEHLI